jgi:hypothetical protein
MKITRTQLKQIISESMSLEEDAIRGAIKSALGIDIGDSSSSSPSSSDYNNDYSNDGSDDDTSIGSDRRDSYAPTSMVSNGNYTPQESDVIEIVVKVIGRDGESKSYGSNKRGLFVDSKGDTAVGILHFTTSGMQKLYDAMSSSGVIGKYFSGKSLRDLESYTSSVNGSEGQENGALTSSGVKDVAGGNWWLKGMVAFLDSSDSVPVQNKAVLKKFYDRIPNYSNFPFRDKRDLAIFISLANSRWSNITTLGPRTGWNPDKMMDLYCKQKRRSRCKIVKRQYPRN